MELLRRAGVDLRQPDTVTAVVSRFDALVARLERELAEAGLLAGPRPDAGPLDQG
jgi:hypothetical protein